MATGFMPRIIAVLLLGAAALAAHAQNVALVGVIGERAAILSFDGGEPKTVRVGQQWKGVSVLAVDSEQATIEIAGKKRVLARGQHFGVATADHQIATLAADSRGHFVADAAINGVPVRMLVDTGATTIALPAAEATRLGIDYRKGERGMSRTAGGPVTVWRVRFDSVRIGTIELAGVE